MTPLAPDTDRHPGPGRHEPPVSDTVAWVAGEPVPASRVTERLGELYAGPASGRFPRSGRESRQLRRWVGQLLIAEAVCAAAARRAGLSLASAPLPLDEVATVELGSLATSVLHSSGYARAVYRDLLAGCVVADADAEDFYRRNRDLFRSPEALACGGGATLPYPRVRAGIVAHLRDAAARRRFLHWLDARTAELVEICPGWEHPGDPSQPDNTHRH